MPGSIHHANSAAKAPLKKVSGKVTLALCAGVKGKDSPILANLAASSEEAVNKSSQDFEWDRGGARVAVRGGEELYVSLANIYI